MRAIQSRFASEASTEQLAEMAASATLQRFKAGDYVFQEGDDGDCLHLVRIGSLTISRNIGGKDIVLTYVAAGNYVGEMALMGESKRSASARAAIATETIRLDGAVFKKLISRIPALTLRLQKEFKERTAANLAMQSMPGGGDIISFLMAQGAGEATDILLIDESLCVRCDNCEKACAETHGGTSRLDREAGPTFANVHVPTSCRHCEHPHCMKDCPPDALRRAPNGEVFIADNCIGCGNCERNCPYGVIHMASKPPKKPGLLQWLLLGRGPGPGEAPYDPEREKGSDGEESRQVRHVQGPGRRRGLRARLPDRRGHPHQSRGVPGLCAIETLSRCVRTPRPRRARSATTLAARRSRAPASAIGCREHQV